MRCGAEFLEDDPPQPRSPITAVFSYRARAGESTALLGVPVHVASLSTDEGLIDFHDSAQLVFHKAASLHRHANAVHHKPSRLLCDAKRTVNLIAGNAILCIGQKPHGGKPFVERDGQAFKDRSNLYAELFGS